MFSQRELKSYKNVLEKKYKSKAKIEEKLKEFILKKQRSRSNINEIPGNITYQKKTKNNKKKSKNKEQSQFVKDFKSLPEQEQELIINISNELSELYKKNNLTPLSLFFIFQLIFNNLNITDDMMNKITSRYRKKGNDNK